MRFSHTIYYREITESTEESIRHNPCARYSEECIIRNLGENCWDSRKTQDQIKRVLMLGSRLMSKSEGQAETLLTGKSELCCQQESIMTDAAWPMMGSRKYLLHSPKGMSKKAFFLWPQSWNTWLEEARSSKPSTKDRCGVSIHSTPVMQRSNTDPGTQNSDPPFMNQVS